MPEIVSFEELPQTSLKRNAIYQGGPNNLVNSDPFCRMFRCGNQGGIRKVRVEGELAFVVLYSSGSHPEMLDEVDDAGRRAIFHGDNRVDGDLFSN